MAAHGSCSRFFVVFLVGFSSHIVPRDGDHVANASGFAAEFGRKEVAPFGEQPLVAGDGVRPRRKRVNAVAELRKRRMIGKNRLRRESGGFVDELAADVGRPDRIDFERFDGNETEPGEQDTPAASEEIAEHGTAVGGRVDNAVGVGRVPPDEVVVGEVDAAVGDRGSRLNVDVDASSLTPRGRPAGSGFDSIVVDVGSRVSWTIAISNRRMSMMGRQTADSERKQPHCVILPLAGD